MAKKFSVKTNLHRRDIRGVSTYVVLREASDHFNETGVIEVIGFIDNHPIEGALQPKTDGERYLGETRALILAPTRELAQQIYKDCLDLTKFTDLHTVCLLGGTDYEQQIKSLNKKFVDINP